jgi:hypothetical protein
MPTKDPQLIQIASTAAVGTLASIFLSYDPKQPKKPKIKVIQSTVKRFLVGFIVGCLVLHFYPDSQYLNIAATSCGSCGADLIVALIVKIMTKLIIDPIKTLKEVKDIWKQ